MYHRQYNSSAVDFRSDTVTLPTQRMRDEMSKCLEGDDVYRDNIHLEALQEQIASLTGKEAGLFMVSGTMSNQIAIRSHLYSPPHAVLCDYRSHVYVYEVGGIGVFSQALVHPVHPKHNQITLEDVKRTFVPDDDFHYCPTKLISLENTLGGSRLPIQNAREISDFARNEKKIPIHLDGARLWEACASPREIKEYCELFDSVSLCFSKGLGAPIGSMLVGSRKYIERARTFRKMMGGGIRQGGSLAIAASVALDEIWPKLKRVHERARELSSWAQEHGWKLEWPTETNMIWLNLVDAKVDASIIEKLGKDAGILINSGRVVLHHQITDEAIEELKRVLEKSYAIGLSGEGIVGGKKRRSYAIK